MSDCIFCGIADKTNSAVIVFESPRAWSAPGAQDCQTWPGVVSEYAGRTETRQPAPGGSADGTPER
jgi:hypothetical protein